MHSISFHIGRNRDAIINSLTSGWRTASKYLVWTTVSHDPWLDNIIALIVLWSTEMNQCLVEHYVDPRKQWMILFDGKAIYPLRYGYSIYAVVKHEVIRYMLS